MQKYFFVLLVVLTSNAICSAQDSASYAVYTSSDAPALGIYQSADDFLNLHPTNTEVIFEHIAQVSGEGFNNFYFRKGNGKRGEKISPDSCFAASDGKTFYIPYLGKWHKAKKIDNVYSFTGLKPRLSAQEAERAKLMMAGPGGAFVPAYFMEDSYRMVFSTTQRKWIAVSKVGKKSR